MTAGSASMTRKIATPASRARIVTAGATARLEKTRSPDRRRPPDAAARSWPALVVVSVGLQVVARTARAPRVAGPRCAYPSRLRSLRRPAAIFFGQGVGERRRAGVFGGRFLTFGADHVFEERLDHAASSAEPYWVQAIRGDEDDRVGALRFGLAVEFERRTCTAPSPSSFASGDSSRIFAAASGVGSANSPPTLILAMPSSPAWLASA